MLNLKAAAWCLMPTHYHLLMQTPDKKTIIRAVCGNAMRLRKRR